MKHSTKRTLVFLYMTLTAIGLALFFTAKDPFGGGIAAPEAILILFWAVSGDAAGAAAVLRDALAIAVILLEASAPLCTCFRLYWPFHALLGAKALFAGAAVLLSSGEGYLVVLFLLHTALFMLALMLFRRKAPEDAPDVEIAVTMPVENCPRPSQGLHMPGSGFPDR